jgi:hypothetical protein
MQPLLSGQQEYVEATVDPRVRTLDAENRRLDEALRLERIKTGQMEHGVRELRRQLTPLYRALQAVFGELDGMGIRDADNPPAPQFDKKWELWKQKLGAGTAPSRVIDALLSHGPLTRTQLRQAGELGWSTLDVATSRLKNLGLIEKAGDRWNLKPQ